ncbi:exported hypothetical protein [Verrucomicrobia bacterium]|nr:exported hypothetical protein [Verrucomicrobiota bacterium]
MNRRVLLASCVLFGLTLGVATFTILNLRQSMRFGLPVLRKRLSAVAGRVTNVEPLPRKVLEEIYSRPERDEPGVRQLSRAQASGVGER